MKIFRHFVTRGLQATIGMPSNTIDHRSLIACSRIADLFFMSSAVYLLMLTRARMGCCLSESCAYLYHKLTVIIHYCLSTMKICIKVP